MSNFKSKEEYLTFISAWKSATNSEEAKSKRLTCDYEEYMWDSQLNAEQIKNYESKGFTVSKNGRTIKKKDGAHYKEKGNLNSEHYLFYNMKKGKDPKHGFTPITAKRKLEPGETVWRGFESASWALQFIVKDAQGFMADVEQGKKSNYGRRANHFLKPFGGNISIGDLANIDPNALEQARKVHR